MKVQFNPQSISYKVAPKRSIKVKNIEKVPYLSGLVEFGNNVYSSVGKLNGEQLMALRYMGIKKVVDLANYENYKPLVEQNSMEYKLCEIKDFDLGILTEPAERKFGIYSGFRYNDDKFKKKVDKDDREKISREYVGNFVKLINYIREGNCFISQNYTGSIVNGRRELEMLESCFNPGSIYNNKKYLFPAMDWKDIRVLYNHFTAEDKKLMGWTEEFEQSLIKKLDTHQG